MELVVASVLCYLNHPKRSRVELCPEREGILSKAAAGRQSDILVTPANVNTFQVVCAVSANKAMSDGKSVDQLDAALKHARKYNEEAEVVMTYVLLLNLREIGRDRRLHQKFQTFVEEHSDELRLWAPSDSCPWRRRNSRFW